MSLKEQEGTPSGVVPLGNNTAIWGDISNGYGVFGSSNSNGVVGQSGSGIGVQGLGLDGIAVQGDSVTGTGVQGLSEEGGIGVEGISPQGIGISASSDIGIALVVNGLIQVTGNAVGQATLSMGETSVTVNSAAAKATSNILLTPLGDPGGQLWVTRAAGSFTIQTSTAPLTNVDIAYLVIN